MFIGWLGLKGLLNSTYLLLAECEVRTASYGPSFFLPFMAQACTCSTWAMKNKEEKNEDP